MQAVNTRNSGDETGAGQFAVSSGGTLAFVTGGIVPDRKSQLVWVDRSGAETPLKEPPAAFSHPRISPDGKYLAYNVLRSGTRERDVWVYDLTRETATRLTTEGNALEPVWSPDSRRIIFPFRGKSRSESHLALLPVDGSGKAEQLQFTVRPSTWSTGGSLMAVLGGGREPSDDPDGQAATGAMRAISVVAMDGGRQPHFSSNRDSD